MPRGSDKPLLLPLRIVEDFSYDLVPNEWKPIGLDHFSANKTLYDYQQKALINCIIWLYLYFGDTTVTSVAERKRAWFDRMKNMLDSSGYDGSRILRQLGIERKNSSDIFSVLREMYTAEKKNPQDIEVNYIPFYNFVNRVGFWMATGSGKSLVLVKLIEILDRYFTSGIIQTGTESNSQDILILTYREDLIEQLKALISEYNRGRSRQIQVWSLQDYDRVKARRALIDDSKINIFIYRSDLISDETKRKQISFRDIDNDGQWFILLDEAHKGDNTDSKRQQYYSILSRNGLLFNFSATFTDQWDIMTTVYNFNLAEFNRAGYGKNMYLMHGESTRSFDENMDEEDKRNLILQMLILYTYIDQSRETIRSTSPTLTYHKPLLVILGNTVNTTQADVKTVFRLIEDIATGKVGQKEVESAREKLTERLEGHSSYCFGGEQFTFDATEIKSIDDASILECVFHAQNPGEIEVIRNAADTEQLVFKLKSSDKLFMLLKIGNITEWLKDEFRSGYTISEEYDHVDHFTELKNEDNTITILLGSRAFYEGWDLNRPNIMSFINIGVGPAKKFVLQALGRGVRIEPILGERKRFGHLPQRTPSSPLLSGTQSPPLDAIHAIETLFVFGTNESNIKKIMEEIKVVQTAGGAPLKLRENPNLHSPLLIPVYSEPRPAPLQDLPEFEGIQQEIKGLVEWVDDDRVLYAVMQANMENELAFPVFKRIKEFVQTGTYTNEPTQLDPVMQLSRLAYFVQQKASDAEGCKELTEEIVHFRHISADLDKTDVTTLQGIMDKVASYGCAQGLKRKMRAAYKGGELTDDEFDEQYHQLDQIQSSEDFDSIQVRYISQHYYIPLLLSKGGKGKLIKHIIQVESEREFIQDLEAAVKNDSNNPFKGADWWMFSKIVERVDDVYVPYASSTVQDSRWYPDFIFWVKDKNDHYHIIFLDPKGHTYADYQKKIDGFLKLFWDNGCPRQFQYDSMTITVHMRMYGKNIQQVGTAYSKYWIDDAAKIADILKE